jgi:hypothetical protein
MKNITINGVGYSHFFKMTKSALELLMGTTIKHDHKVEQFLTNQLDASNEHGLPALFNESSFTLSSQLKTTSNPVDDTVLINTLAGIDFLHSNNDDNEYIDREFSIKAHDHGITCDVSIDFRLTCHSEENNATIIVNKNYGDGPVGNMTEFSVADIPNLENSELTLPAFISMDEIMDAYVQLGIIYDAFANNPVLNSTFLKPKKTIKALMNGIEIECKPISLSSYAMFDEKDADEAMESFDAAMQRIEVNKSIDQLKNSSELGISPEIEKEMSAGDVFIISVTEFQDSDSGMGKINTSEDPVNTACLDFDLVPAKLEEAFRLCFPNKKNTAQKILGFQMVKDKIITICDYDEDDIETLTNNINFMSNEMVTDWLIINFNISDLIDNMLEPLTDGCFEIKWEMIKV